MEIFFRNSVGVPRTHLMSVFTEFFFCPFFDSFFFSGCDVIRERGGGHRSILKMNWNCPDDDVINLGTIWLVGWWVVTSSTVERLMKKKSKSSFFQPILLTSTCRRLSSTRRFESQNWWTFHKERSSITNFFNFFFTRTSSVWKAKAENGPNSILISSTFYLFYDATGHFISILNFSKIKSCLLSITGLSEEVTENGRSFLDVLFFYDFFFEFADATSHGGH